MNTGTGRMSIRFCAMRCASLRSPPACVRTERTDSDTPRSSAAAALLDSFRARPPFAIPAPSRGGILALSPGANRQAATRNLTAQPACGAPCALRHHRQWQLDVVVVEHLEAVVAPVAR